MTKILLFGDNYLSAFSNTPNLNTTIDYLISTKRFDDSKRTLFLKRFSFLSLRLEGEETLKYHCICRSLREKCLIYSK